MKHQLKILSDAVTTSSPAPIAASAAASVPTSSGPSCARSSKARASARNRFGLVERIGSGRKR